jgi:hypothetical protein
VKVCTGYPEFHSLAIIVMVSNAVRTSNEISISFPFSPILRTLSPPFCLFQIFGASRSATTCYLYDCQFSLLGHLYNRPFARTTYVLTSSSLSLSLFLFVPKFTFLMAMSPSPKPSRRDSRASPSPSGQRTLTPQRKHRKMLKDGTSEVWPESVEKIFVDGETIPSSSLARLIFTCPSL